MKKLDKHEVICLFCTFFIWTIVSIVGFFSGFFLYSRIDFFREHEILFTIVLNLICAVVYGLLFNFFLHLLNKDHYNHIKPTKISWFRFGDHPENKYNRRKFRKEYRKTTPLYEAIKKGSKGESQVDLLLKYGMKLDESCLEAARLSRDKAMIEKVERLMKDSNL